MRLPRASLLLIVSVACSSGAAFSAEDLPSIALSPDPPPEGTAYVAEQSGEQTLEDFGGSSTELGEQGFLGAYSAVFVGEGEDDGHAHQHTLQVANFLAVFEDGEGAQWSLDAYRGRFPQGSYETLPAEGLGDDAFAAHGEGSEETGGEPWTVYSWRTGNLHVSLSIQGDLALGEAEALATEVDLRVDSVAAA